MQWLAVDSSDGAAYVLFYDRRGDSENLLPTVTLARSTDGGRTFANYALSDVASDPKKASYGEYIGLAAQDGRVYAAWIEHKELPAWMELAADLPSPAWPKVLTYLATPAVVSAFESLTISRLRELMFASSSNARRPLSRFTTSPIAGDRCLRARHLLPDRLTALSDKANARAFGNV